ncbi:patatin-like phospholipase family protein [Singulisphaera acidiphila]|uniref:Arabinose efflux permease family protein n=1 Tax=Singulisphaera acidiphila (strain ATCC BAA-1392 / DSM 18658 / VKM B-2454 / MOB10) TaxID=886293 RepID=L0DQQ8_SINAD|nr:patatin-like phospholipase family protein [Singulisphaera acidiphila]AGA31318.1 arabinose efflux permease family protein [Singulisphaera acidiphila DSM 18658]
MDVLRTVLLFGLVILVWKFPLLKTRPVRDLIEWGMSYPLLFSLIAGLTLVLWGIVGESYGLQTMFFDDNGMVQFLNGTMVFLFLSYATFMGHVILPNRESWLKSVGLSVNVLESIAGKSTLLDLPGNEFLEKLGLKDLGQIRRIANREGKLGGGVSDSFLDDWPFRLAFAPAVLLVINLMLVGLLGVVPALIIPISRNDKMLIVSRLPWLLGTLYGGFCGVTLATRTSHWLAKAAGWLSQAAPLAPGIGARSASGINRPISKNPVTSANQNRSRILFRFLLAVYLLVGLVASSLPDLFPTLAKQLHERSEQSDLTHAPYLQISFATIWLVVAALLATRFVAPKRLAWLATFGLITYFGAGEVSAANLGAWFGGILLLVAAISGGLVATFGNCLLMAVVSLVHQCFTFLGRYKIWVVLLTPAVMLDISLIPPKPLSVPLGATSWLVAAAAIWLVCFRWGTASDLRSWWPLELAPWKSPQRTTGTIVFGVLLLMATLCILGILNPLGKHPTGPAGLMIAALLLTTLAADRIGAKSRNNTTVFVSHNVTKPLGLDARVGVGGVVILLLSSLAGYLVAAVVAFLGMLVLGAITVSTVARSNRPAIAYPFASIFAFCAFAMAYNSFDALPELGTPGILQDWGGALLPAAASLIALAVLITSFYVTIKATWPRHGTMICLGLVTSLFVLNGNNWFVKENQFKLTFPGLEPQPPFKGILSSLLSRPSTDAKRPIYLDTRAYFREPLDGTVRLRNLDRLKETNRNLGRPDIDLLGTVYFEVEPIQSADQKITLKIDDRRRRFRARSGDIVYITTPTGKENAESESPKGRVKTIHRGKIENCYDSQFFILSDLTAKKILSGNKLNDPIKFKQLVTEKLDNNLLILDWPILDVNASQLIELKGKPKDNEPVTTPGRILDNDCLALVDTAAEDPVTADLYCVSSADSDTPEKLREKVIEGRKRYEKEGASGKKQTTYRMELARDRGRFAPAPQERTASSMLKLKFFNGDRVRWDDRIVLKWTDPVDSKAPESLRARVFKIREISEGTNGARFVTLEPEETLAQGGEKLEPTTSGTWQLLMPWNNLEVLRAWKKFVTTNKPEHYRPPLVIVTVSGGGIRSSVWTSRVLTTLENRLGEKFRHHIRLITGASGGMVGGSYYASEMPTGPRGFQDLDQQVEQMGQDQLNGVAGCMIFSDIPALLNPFPRNFDRGKALERTWKLLTTVEGVKSPLARPIRGFAADELLGRRPSLVFTPMMVEDGRRLLISNLDLTFATRSLGSMFLEADSRKSNVQEDAARATGQHAPGIPNELYSLSAVELFRLFPNAHEFSVATAARMSASFPWISPVVSLPTAPSRRVVDAGYYDNYGVNLAAMWLVEMQDWLVENTSGVLVVQIRDQVSQEARTEVGKDSEFERPSSGLGLLLDRLTWQVGRYIINPGFQPLNTPLHGLSTARQWSMSFRNDEQIELLNDIFLENHEMKCKNPQFFETVVFECPVEAALNWKLSDRERSILKASLPSKRPCNIDETMQYVDSELEKLEESKTDRDDVSTKRKRIYAKALKDLNIETLSPLSLLEAERLFKNYSYNETRLSMLIRWWETRPQDPTNTATAPPQPIAER